MDQTIDYYGDEEDISALAQLHTAVISALSPFIVEIGRAHV